MSGISNLVRGIRTTAMTAAGAANKPSGNGLKISAVKSSSEMQQTARASDATNNSNVKGNQGQAQAAITQYQAKQS